MSKTKFTIGVFAAIFDKDNRILLCHRTDYDLWNLPGGSLEENEAPWEGIIREVKEETGLDVKVKRITGIYNKPDQANFVIQFVCQTVGGHLALNQEADKIKYFSFSDIPKNTPPKHIERVRDILENPDRIVMKTQSGKSSIQLIKDGLL